MKKKDATIISVIAGVLFLGGGGGLIGKFYTLLGKTEKIEEEVKDTKKDLDKNAERDLEHLRLLEKVSGELTAQSKITDKLLNKALNNVQP